MKKMLFIMAVFMLGCSTDMPPKKCDYCKGDIFWHKVVSGDYSSRYKMNSSENEG